MEARSKTDVEETPVRSEWLLDLGNLMLYPMCLRAVAVLNVPKIMNSVGPDAALSAEEICMQMPGGAETNSFQNLEKILEVLTLYGFFTGTIVGGVQKFGLTSDSRNLAKDEIADVVAFATAPELLRVWPHLHQIVTDRDQVPFERIYKKGYYEFLAEDAPATQELYVRALTRASAPQTEALLEVFEEDFKTLSLSGQRLVDVGGQQGATVAAIIAKYPHLQCVNFDLPMVVSGAPEIPGVVHVGGSFLDTVPEADMLIMRYILLNWDDKQCIQILKNCYKALPASGGKMIIMDRVTTRDENRPIKSRLQVAGSNILCTMLFKDSGTRSFEKLQVLATSAGFAKVEVVHTFGSLTLLQALKSPHL